MSSNSKTSRSNSERDIITRSINNSRPQINSPGLSAQEAKRMEIEAKIAAIDKAHAAKIEACDQAMEKALNGADPATCLIEAGVKDLPIAIAALVTKIKLRDSLKTLGVKVSYDCLPQFIVAVSAFKERMDCTTDGKLPSGMEEKDHRMKQKILEYKIAKLKREIEKRDAPMTAVKYLGKKEKRRTSSSRSDRGPVNDP
ncbi:hypothetical protein [Mariniblastus fucicola]|nr:hypothetical protein [Mariniblastus fucicola]